MWKSSGLVKCVPPLASSRRFGSTLSQIRLPKHNLKKPHSNVVNQSIRRKGQDLEHINYIRSLLDKKPKESLVSDQALIEDELSIVTTITVSESINLNRFLQDNLINSGQSQCSVLVPEEVVNVKDSNGNDIMVLANGTIVGWGVDEEYLLHRFVPQVSEYIENKYNFESEEMDWIELSQDGRTINSNVNAKNDTAESSVESAVEVRENGDSRTAVSSSMEGEIMIIQGETENKKLLDKAAFAIGLSRSTRLAVLETALEEHLLLTKIHSESLSKGIKLKITENDVLKSTGRLFLLRGKLNLYSELIETPDLYWAEPTLEKIYNSISKTLDISPRISILNRKLDYATEESRALLSVLNEKKGTRLEWIIIILITVEVGFEIERRIKGV